MRLVGGVDTMLGFLIAGFIAGLICGVRIAG